MLEMDVSASGIGVVLVQEGRHLAFLSQASAPKHMGLSIYEKELLVVLKAVDKWRHYSEGGTFVIKIDHESLKFLLQQRLHTHSQQKGMTKLMRLDYFIQYRRGKENLATNTLSWCFEEGHSNWCQEISLSYETDGTTKELLQWLVVNPIAKPGYTLTNGIIRYQGRLVLGNDERLRQKMIEALHNSPLGGHSGIINTYHKVRQLFQWTGLKKDVIEFAMGCDTCKRCKIENVAYPRLLPPLNIPGEPWESISMDFIEGLPKSEGNDCIMVIVDRFTK